MKLELFSKIIQRLKEQSEVNHKLYELGVDLIELVDTYHTIIGDMLKEEYGEEGYEMWSWFVHDRDFGRRTDLTAYYQGEEICQDVKALWEYMEKYK